MRHEAAGHMKKGRLAIEKYAKLIDCPLLVLDSRVPDSSWPKSLADQFGKKLWVILNKAELAQSGATEKWRAHFEREGYHAFAVDAKSGRGMGALRRSLTARAEGRPVRVAVLGMPNTGKSTVLNFLLGKRSLRVGNRPGITRGPQWIRQGKLEVLDTPGICGLGDLKNPALAALGFFEAEPETTASWILEWLKESGAQAPQRYSGAWELEEIGKILGFLRQGGEVDLHRAAVRVVLDFQGGILGPVTLERAP